MKTKRENHVRAVSRFKSYMPSFLDDIGDKDLYIGVGALAFITISVGSMIATYKKHNL